MSRPKKKDRTLILTIELEIEESDYREFLERNGGDLNEWIYGELCQNQGLGFLVGLNVKKANRT